ncbi:MAG: fibronectin type III domain-containing protein [Myxococcota bacterium]
MAAATSVNRLSPRPLAVIILRACATLGAASGCIGLAEQPPTEESTSAVLEVVISQPTIEPTHATDNPRLALAGTATGEVADVTWKNDRGGTGVATGTSSWSVSEMGLQPGDNLVTVTATDAQGNSSSDSLTVQYTPAGTGDVTPPTVPEGLQAVALAPHQTRLSWSPSVDDVGVVGYRIYRDGAWVGSTSTTSYMNGGLSPATTYSYAVAAVDAQGNPSALSSPSSVTTPAQSSPTPLGTLAASMQPGTWAKLETNDFQGGAIFKSVDDGSILEFTNEAQWDPVGRRVFIIGTARGNSAAYGVRNQKWVQYSEATNSWTELPTPTFYIGFHSYDHAALDPATGDYFVRLVSSNDVRRYSVLKGSWEALPNIPYDYGDCCNALEYFGEMKALVFVRGSSNGTTELYRFDLAGTQWQKLSTPTNVVMGNFHEVADYSPVHRVLFFGGGDIYNDGNTIRTRSFFKLDESGAVTRLADTPAPFAVSGVVTVVDPATGNLLLFPKTPADTFYEHLYGSDTWVSHRIDFAFSTTDVYGGQTTVATAIPEYGVVVFFKHAGGGSGVFVYKHKPQ